MWLCQARRNGLLPVLYQKRHFVPASPSPPGLWLDPCPCMPARQQTWRHLPFRLPTPTLDLPGPRCQRQPLFSTTASGVVLTPFPPASSRTPYIPGGMRSPSLHHSPPFLTGLKATSAETSQFSSVPFNSTPASPEQHDQHHEQQVLQHPRPVDAEERARRATQAPAARGGDVAATAGLRSTHVTAHSILSSREEKQGCDTHGVTEEAISTHAGRQAGGQSRRPGSMRAVSGRLSHLRRAACLPCGVPRIPSHLLCVALLEQPRQQHGVGPRRRDPRRVLLLELLAPRRLRPAAATTAAGSGPTVVKGFRLDRHAGNAGSQAGRTIGKYLDAHVAWEVAIVPPRSRTAPPHLTTTRTHLVDDWVQPCERYAGQEPGALEVRVAAAWARHPPASVRPSRCVGVT